MLTARLQPPHHHLRGPSGVEMADPAGAGLHHHRHVELHHEADDGALKAAVCHADDRHGLPIDLNGLADDGRVGAEGAAPQPVAEDDDRVFTGRDFIRRQQRSPQLCADAQHLEVVTGDHLAPHPVTGAAEAEDDRLHVGGRQALEALRMIAEMFEVQIRRAVQPPSDRAVRNHGKAGGVWHSRQRIEREGLEHREDGRVAADPEREHGDHREREAGVSPDAAGCRTGRPDRRRPAIPRGRRARRAACLQWCGGRCRILSAPEAAPSPDPRRHRGDRAWPSRGDCEFRPAGRRLCHSADATSSTTSLPYPRSGPGLSTPPIAATSCSHLLRSRSSCFLPAGVSR